MANDAHVMIVDAGLAGLVAAAGGRFLVDAAE